MTDTDIDILRSLVLNASNSGAAPELVTPDLALFDDAIEQQFFQFLGQVGVLDVGVLDLLFDVLFFVGQVFIDFAVALDVGLLFQ